MHTFMRDRLSYCFACNSFRSHFRIPFTFSRVLRPTRYTFSSQTDTSARQHTLQPKQRRRRRRWVHDEFCKGKLLPPHYIARREKMNPFLWRSSSSRPTGITTTPFFLRCIAKSRLRLRSDAFRTDGRIRIASMRQFAKKCIVNPPRSPPFPVSGTVLFLSPSRKGEKCVAA